LPARLVKLLSENIIAKSADNSFEALLSELHFDELPSVALAGFRQLARSPPYFLNIAPHLPPSNG
jgi:hypothetical protein